MHKAWHNLLLLSEWDFCRHIVCKSCSAIPTHTVRSWDQWNLVVCIKADTLFSVLVTLISQVFKLATHVSSWSQVFFCWQWGKGAGSTSHCSPSTQSEHHCKVHPWDPILWCRHNPHHTLVNIHSEMDHGEGQAIPQRLESTVRFIQRHRHKKPYFDKS